MVSLSEFVTLIEEQSLVTLLADLVRIPSYPGIPDQESAVANYIAAFLRTEGLEVQLQPVVDGRYNVVARLMGRNYAEKQEEDAGNSINDDGKGRTLLLLGHLDTVPPYGMSGNPLVVQVVDGHLRGRGTVDMKGGLACMMMALVVLKRAGVELEGEVILAGVIDEEERSAGTRALLQDGLRVDAAIVGEPTDLEIGLGHRGLEWLEFLFIGREAHGGVASGVNAIAQAAKFIERLEGDLQPELAQRCHALLGAASMNYGLIRGGTQPSTVPESCVLQVDRRWIPGENYDEVLQEYQQVLEELRREDSRVEVSMRVMESSLMPDGFVHESCLTDSEHPLVGILASSVHSVRGEAPNMTVFPGWTDAGLLNYYGQIPSLIFGPGKLEYAHSSEERIAISQLVPATLIYALAIVEFCGAKSRKA